jgi:ubiquinone/menaquinone biosynthesis C-methylase UbiE
MLSKTSNDVTNNRSNIPFSKKIGLLVTSLKENGGYWTSLLSVYYVASAIGNASISLADAIFVKLQKIKKEQGLPGTSSLVANKNIWESWDWNTAGGEEWTLSKEWKESLIKNVLHKYIPSGGYILEIGCGAGRWTEVLVEMTSQFIGVDISESCIKICSEKFGNKPGRKFLLGNGKDLSGVETDSIDALWSFDVFVHINKAEVASYVQEFNRVMRQGSIGVVHHGASGGIDGGWRSDLTTTDFHSFLKKENFSILDYFDTWNDKEIVYPVGLYHDELTIFQKIA